MFIDSQSLESGSRITADVCIMGAGAAGITMALEFTGSGLQVCILESGGFEFEDETQALYQGHNAGQDYPDLDISRLRMFGGTTHHWSGSCGPLDPMDFAPRAWVPHSGWPFDREQLDPFYERAQKYCQLGPYRYDIDFWREKAALISLPTNPENISNKVLQSSPPTRFGEVYRSAIAQAPNVRVLLHANVTELENARSLGGVSRIHAAALDGPRFTVEAKTYVLALGGIENARMLLLSNRHQPNGLGNSNNLVGRFFMDHPTTEGAFLFPTKLPLPSFSSDHTLQHPAVTSFLQLGDAALRKHGLLNVKFSLIPATRYHLSDGIASYHTFRRAFENDTLPDDLWDHIGNIATDLDMVAEAVSRKSFDTEIFDSAKEIIGYVVHAMIEQTPDPESRVTLSDKRDALGLQRSNVTWKLANRDRENLWAAYRVLAGELGRLGLGRILLKSGDRAQRALDELLGFGNHHMGTTRAHVDARNGVVDKNLKLHEVPNLFVVGSSVFTTGGHVPPTLTIVALAIRLSDHLKRVTALVE